MKKIGLIVLALVLALGALGAGYAAWQQTLNINGTVQTGKLAVNFANSNSSGAVAVGSTYATATKSVIGDGTDALTVVIANAYPGLVVDIPFGVQNTGTVATSEAWGTIVVGPIATDITVSGNLPGVISPGTTDNTGKVTLTVADSAVQNGSYSVTIPIVASQYTP